MMGLTKCLLPLALILLGSAWFSSAVPVAPPYHMLKGRAQGTTYHIRYAAERPVLDSAEVASLFAEVDRSLSLYLESSLICRFNRSQKGVRADTHMLRVVRKSIEVYKQSGGAFDITVKPLLDLYKAHPHPTDGAVGEVLRCLGSHRIGIEGDSVIKDCHALQLDANGIAQGYTVDLLAARLESKGVGDYLVELGGEIRSRGVNAQGETWVLGLEAPTEDGLGTVLAKRIRPCGMSVTTSGNWHLKASGNGRRGAHIMDPRQGRPSDNRMVSATVVAGDAITADALDNVCMVLGPVEGIRFIEGLADVEAWLLYRDGKGRLMDTCSRGFRRFEAE